MTVHVSWVWIEVVPPHLLWLCSCCNEWSSDLWIFRKYWLRWGCKSPQFWSPNQVFRTRWEASPRLWLGSSTFQWQIMSWLQALYWAPLWKRFLVKSDFNRTGFHSFWAHSSLSYDNFSLYISLVGCANINLLSSLDSICLRSIV